MKRKISYTVAKGTDKADKWHSDAGNFWRFRCIHSRFGLDYVPNRGGFDEGKKTEARTAFIQLVTGSEEFVKWTRNQSGSSSEVFKVDEGGRHFRATNNASYGYCYLWAWEDEKQADPLTGFPCSCRPGQERDNCPRCEGTGKEIDFRAFHAAKKAV